MGKTKTSLKSAATSITSPQSFSELMRRVNHLERQNIALQAVFRETLLRLEGVEGELFDELFDEPGDDDEGDIGGDK